MSDKQSDSSASARWGVIWPGGCSKPGYELVIFDTNETGDAAAGAARRKARQLAGAMSRRNRDRLVSLPTPDIVKAVALGEMA